MLAVPFLRNIGENYVRDDELYLTLFFEIEVAKYLPSHEVAR